MKNTQVLRVSTILFGTLLCAILLAGVCLLLPSGAYAQAAEANAGKTALTTNAESATTTSDKAALSTDGQSQDNKSVSHATVYTIRTAAQWRDISKYKGGTFKLANNVTLPNESYYTNIKNNYSYTIDLNGFMVKTAYTGVPLRTVAPLHIAGGTVYLKSSVANKGILYSTETAAVVLQGYAKFYLQSGSIVNNATEFRSDITSAIMAYGASQCYLQGTSRIQSIGNGIALFEKARLYATGNPWVRAGANEYKGQFMHYGCGINIASRDVRVSLKGGSYGTKASPDISLWSPAVTMTYAQSANYPILDQMGYAMDTAIPKGYHVLDAKGNVVKPRASNLSDYYDGVNHPSWADMLAKFGLKQEQRYTTTVKDAAGYYAVYVQMTPAEKKRLADEAAAKAKLRKASVPVYWIVNPKTGENMYTTDANEVKVLCTQRKTWTNKGVAWYAPKTGKPVYRLCSKSIWDHHYTDDPNEVKVLTQVRKTWTRDGNGAMWQSGGNVRTYRLWSKARFDQKLRGQHRFATSTAQVDTLKKQGWSLDNVKMYGAVV